MPDEVERDFENQILFVLGTFEGLVEKGLTTRDTGAPRLTAAGMESYRQLLAAGYRPTPEQLQNVVRFLASNEV